jgi:pimeloyl-ACP methyl ester carboxylesterase
MSPRSVRTPLLDIAYLESGPPNGAPVVLLHGWPSDVHDWDRVAPALAAAGPRVLVPWLRGFGPTRFLDAGTMRSGQQGAIGVDLRDFLDVLAIPSALLVGYDWGGRAACVVAALWPERVKALVTINGYAIQDIAAAKAPADIEQEHRYWYHWYMNTARGAQGLAANRVALARKLWRLWSPNWDFEESELAASAASFDNPDFVAVTLHSYRHRYGYAPDDPMFEPIERALAALPRIEAPTVVLHGEADGVGPPYQSENSAERFARLRYRRLVPVAGHFLSREAPREVIDAVRTLAAG